ncbi:MAG: DUF2334 domain-containing protein [Gemmatimonadales bacterium]
MSRPPGVLLVSIHDVTPALDERVRALWAMCHRRGVTPALLVVPNWHGEWPLERSPAFVRWVRECADSGADVLLHGERHDETGTPRGWRDAARAWGKTAREGEFLTLDEPAARERIDRGLALFARLGLNAAGFVPPAWLARDGCLRAVAAAGLRYSEDDGAIHIHDPRGMRRLPSPVVRWSGRSSARAYASAAIAAARWRVQRSARHVRLAFHPADLDHPATARSAAKALDRWLGERPASRYTDL